MKILQISAGPNPDPATSNSYLDAIGPGLADLGHEITTLHMAIPGTLTQKTHLSEKLIISPLGNRIREIEVIKSGVYAGRPPGSGSGTRTPLRDIFPERQLKNTFDSILEQSKPDIVHIQNLFGLPVRLVNELKKRQIPVVLTLHDYTPICPISNLFLPSGKNCMLNRDELVCSFCCKKSKGYFQFVIEETLNSLMAKSSPKSMPWICLARIRNAVASLFEILHCLAPRKPQDYVVRFDAMVKTLRNVDCLHCISNVQAVRIQKATGLLDNLKILPLIPPGLTNPKIIEKGVVNGEKLNLCVLNVQMGRNDKGYDFLKQALDILESKRKDFSVEWYSEGVGSDCVQFRGKYMQADLDDIAARSDYCIIPSLWMETLAFTGVEMLSRGVPLICSRRAGVSEWIEDGQTGILFEPTTPTNLFDVLDSLIDQRNMVKIMRDKVAKAVKVKSYHQHLRDFEALLFSCLNKN